MFIAVIIIIFFFLLAIGGSKKKQPTAQKKSYQLSRKTTSRPEVQNRALTQKYSVPQPKVIPKSHPNIVDVSGPAEAIPPTKTSSVQTEVVPWQTRYIYSIRDLDQASRNQKSYYNYFKQQFLLGHPPDLGKNTNYAFILMFDLLEIYNSRKNLRQLHEQLLVLAQEYPETASYAQREYDSRLLIQLKSAGPGNTNSPTNGFIETVPMADIHPYSSSSLGRQNKHSIAMSDEEARLLDQIFYSSSSFFENPFCQSAIVSLFLALLRSLEREFNTSGSTLEHRIDAAARLVAKTHYSYRQDSENDLYSLRSVKNDIRVLLMKLCENTVREQYEYKRRLHILPFYNSAVVTEVSEALENRLLNPAIRLLTGLINTIPTPDNKAETFLNSLSPTRWKFKFENIKTSYTQSKDAKSYKNDVIGLGKLNKTNPSVEHIYFEGAKFIGKEDKVLCLTLYCYYIYHDQRSAKIDDKQLPKTLSKALFMNTSQETEFNNIINDLKKNKDLKVSLSALPEIYKVKRKKIELDKSVILEAENALTGTVDLLNEYLEDDDLSMIEETAAYHAQNQPMRTANSDTAISTTSQYLSDIPLNSTQVSLLFSFEKHNFSITAEDIESFAREHNTFRSQLINSINEAFYELLDDTLIEEDEDYYIINKEYYKRTLQQ